MATPQGKITPLNLPTLQASGLSGSFGGQSSFIATGSTRIEGAGPEAWFGPFQPIAPQAPQTAGRAFNYPVGSNLSYIPRGDSAVTFEQLRMLADNLPMLRIAIEKRKDQIAGWDWDIQPRLEGKDKRAARPKHTGEDPRVKTIREFFRKPDRRRSFHTWLRGLIEDMLVIDAACLYPRMTNGGDLFSLDVVDGSTIKVLIGEDGRIPLPEDGPAYQQILHGVPASDFAADELMYLPRNLRSNRLYGYSPVEQILMTINIALRRDVMTLEYYNAGTIPEGFGTLPATWTVDQIKSFQDWFDALMSGNLAGRRKLRFMPDGFKFTEIRQPPLKDVYDEWIATLICAVFGLPRSTFLADVNRATAQTLQLQSSQEGIGPLKSWVKEAMDDVIRRLMGFDDLEFVWSGDDGVDPLVQAQANQIWVNIGAKSLDEVRVELGLDPYGIGPTTAAPVTPLVESYNQSLENLKKPPQPVAPHPRGKPAVGELEQPMPNGEVGKAADVPFRALKPLSLDRATLHQPMAAMEATWKAILASQAQAARDAITATLSEVAKADDTPDDPASEDEGGAQSDERIAIEVERVIKQLELDLSDAVMSSVVSPMAQAARDAGLRAVAQALNVGVLLGDDPNAGAEPGREIVGGDIFDKINARAVAWAQEHAAELVSGVNDVTRDAVREAVREGLAAGERYTDIIARVESLKAFSDDRAALIAETEIANANSNGALKGLFQARDAGVNVKKAWLVAHMRVCPICIANQAAGPIELEARFPSGDLAPTAHPRCLPGDALVSAVGVRAVTKRWYDGDLVVIRTAGGNEVSCTPNHPILTTRGWVGAHLLNEGDNVICRGFGQAVALAAETHSENVPARIEDIAEAFRCSGVVAAREVPVSAKDFHGDGEGSKVAVVWANRLLRNGDDAARVQHGLHAKFVGGNVQTLPLDSGGAQALLSEGVLAPTRRDMCGGDLAAAGASVHHAPLQGFGFGSRTDGDAGLAKSQAHAAAVDPKRLGHRQLGHAADVSRDDGRVIRNNAALEVLARRARQTEGATISGEDEFVDAIEAREIADRLFGEIAADKIVFVRRAPFAGHVFNLETDSHIYLASGIVTHNCRCALIPHVQDDAKKAAPSRFACN